MIKPRKKDLLRLAQNKDDLQKCARDAVAMYIHLTLAQLHADYINETTLRYNLCMGFVKHQYKVLDKAMRDYDREFRTIVQDGMEFLGGYCDIQDKVEAITDEKQELFASLFEEIHQLVDDYVRKNYKNEENDLEDEIKSM
jgi:hypothetical protein